MTERIGLGTDVLVAPWYPSVLLARTLAALDQVSRGRLVAGLGLGWSVDEFDAVGVPMAGGGRRLEKILDVMAAVWTDPIVDIATTHERITPSAIGLKPVRPAGPPILLAASSGAGLDRIADRADGWLPFGLTLDELAAGWARIGRRAVEQGRDPRSLRLVVRADPHCDGRRLGADRPALAGTCGQVLDDLRRVAELDADEVILDLHETARDVEELLDTALGIREPHLTAAAA